MNERSELLENIIMLLQAKGCKIENFKDELYILLDKYEVQSRSTEIAVLSEDRNDYLVRKFLIAKTVKGLTEKTINHYKTYLRFILARIGKTVDDIGSEQPTEWGASKIFSIINARYEGYMPTIITTNYSGEELVRRMTPPSGDKRNAEKTLDRLKETCVGIDMTWESWRVR